LGGVYGDDSTVVMVMVAALGLSDGILVNDLAMGSRKVDPSRFVSLTAILILSSSYIQIWQ
jgi:hypothetical protein